MSSIPSNTVTSILGAPAAQRQVSAVHDRRFQEVVRSQKVQSQVAREHTESVEDPGEYGVLGVRDGGGQSGGKEKQQPQQPKEQVEIAGLETEAPPPAAKTADVPSHLDISA